jgi:hypothetical protein
MLKVPTLDTKLMENASNACFGVPPAGISPKANTQVNCKLMLSV